MNRDTIIGFVLIGLVLIGFSWYNQPSKEEMEAYQRQQDSIAAVKQDTEAKKAMAEAGKMKFGVYGVNGDKRLVSAKISYKIAEGAYAV